MLAQYANRSYNAISFFTGGNNHYLEVIICL